MTIRRRLPLLLALLLTGGPGLAQEPSGGSWTDPPARAVPETPAPKPAETRAAAPEPPRTEPATRRAEAKARRPVEARRETSRREAIRRAARRATIERQAEASRPAPRPSRLVERRISPRAVVRERVASPRPRFRGPVYGYADPEPMAFPRYGRVYAADPMGAPPEAWHEAADEFRARRIARARAAGYLVMRTRSYAFPDGTVVRRYAPLDGFEAED
ncbi:hypothetical protein [Methylobacterium sp. Leaf118]|uniref:hypothetical protein n=1 Tax=Methylobacterium sp. Leaf118 TaxID=2876562 RepID=UPI001E550880|nr:hypothetical protein [Methylobacterium sp. Leaf118]